MTNQMVAPNIAVISPNSDPAEVVAAITMLVRQLGSNMLSEVATHTAEVTGTTAEEEYTKFSARVDTVAAEYKTFSNKIYNERDEMLGTMVLAALLHSVNLMADFVEACETLVEEQGDDSLDSVDDFTVPEGYGIALNGSKNEH